MDLTISGHLERKKKMENNDDFKFNCLDDILRYHRLKPRKLESLSKEELLKAISKPYKRPQSVIMGSEEFIDKFIESLPLKYKNKL